jgi:tetratricopeptide (TPR) repeat protein
VQTKAASLLAAFDLCNTILDMSCLRGLLFAFAVCGLFLLSQAGSFAQDTPDNQPHIQPRSSGPAPTPRPTPKAQPPAPAPAVEPPAENQQPQPAANQEPQESSSKDSQADFSSAPLAKEPPPAPATDEKSFHPWDPHRAAKDVEVGNYYLKLKNYRAALDRFNDALLYKPHDAEATFGLAQTQEKLELLNQAYLTYKEYLKILPAGLHARESQEAMKRLEPHLDTRTDAGSDHGLSVDHDLDVGESYLSMNNFAAAKDRFEEALRLSPENPRACFRLAQSLQGLRLIEPARLYYKKYLELEPRGPFAEDAKKAIADINAFVGK